MARIVVHSDSNPAAFVTLTVVDDEGGYDGQCAGCSSWSVVGAYGYAPGLDDATQAAAIHLDSGCDVAPRWPQP